LTTWFPLVIDHLYKPAYESAKKFLGTCMSGTVIKIYRALAKTPEGMEIARNIYRKNRPRYNRMHSAKIDVALRWEE